MNTLEQRLGALEKANRRYRTILTLFAGLVIILGITAFTSKSVPDKIVAKRFEVVDDKGTVLVSVGNFEGDGNVATYNSSGSLLVDIIPTSGGHGGMVVWSGYGKKNMAISNVTGGGGQVIVYNSNEQKVVNLGRNTLNAGSIMVNDNNASSLVHITGDVGGNGAVLTYNSSNTQSGRLPQ